MRQCMYCGLRRGNRALERYRMTQRGDHRLRARGGAAWLSAPWCCRPAKTMRSPPIGSPDIVRWIKRETPLAVTLSLGERSEDELRLWREAGADRYLLRFETSDEILFRAIHPQWFPGAPDRLTLLRQLKHLGYEAGGGVMVGIPGQSFESLARRHSRLSCSRSRYDRHRSLHRSSRHAAGLRRAPPADRSCRSGAQHGNDGLQNDRAGPHGLSRRQIFPAPPRSPPSTERMAAGRDFGRRQCRDAESESSEVPALVPDLSRQSLHRRKRDRLRPVPARADSFARTVLRAVAAAARGQLELPLAAESRAISQFGRVARIKR